MAFTGGFKTDIFLSYAQVDNGEEGWIDKFEAHLLSSLKKELGKKAGIVLFRDIEQAYNAYFEPRIQEQIRSAAVMLAIVSPNYQDSGWCMREINEFQSFWQEKHPPLMIQENKARLFHVLISPLPPEKWPAPLKGTNPYCFFDEKGAGHLRYHWDEAEFMKIRDKLVLDIAATLRLLKKIKIDDTDSLSTKPFTIFLAAVSETLKRDKLALKKVLESEKEKITVEWNVPPPDELDKHNAHINTLIPRTDLAVHLVNHREGEPVTDQLDLTYPVVQLDLIHGHGRPQLVLLPEKFINLQLIKDQKQREWITRVKEQYTGTGKTWIDYYETEESLCRLVQDKITEVKKERVARANAVLIYCQDPDRVLANQVEGELLRAKKRAEVLHRDETEDYINVIKRKIYFASDVLFLVDQCNLQQLSETRKRYMNWIAARSSRAKDFWFFVMLRRQQQLKELYYDWMKDKPPCINCHILENPRDDIDPQVLQPLIETLDQRAAS